MKIALKSATRFLSIVLLSTLPFASQLYAASQFSLSAKVGQQVVAAFELYELGNVSETLEKVETIRPRSDFDKAYISRFQGNLNWELGNEEQALKLLQMAVDEDALPEAEQRQSERMLADLYLNQKQTTKAIALYKALIAQEPSEDLYKHLAISYYQEKSWNKLVGATHKAIALSPEFNQSIHILQLSGLYELKDYKRASKTLIKLTQHDADTKRWWMQLASTYRLLKQDKRALATYEQAYQLGFMDSATEIKQLAHFRASLGAPYQAATLLEFAINEQQVPASAKNYQQLAQFWQVAREHDKAQQYWGKSAQLSGDAQHYLTQAQLLHLLGRYETMLTVLAAVKPDNEAQQGKIALTQVQALFALKKYQQAKDIAIELAANRDNKDRALQWVKLLESRANEQQQFAL